jgi:hypothetical protein
VVRRALGDPVATREIGLFTTPSVFTNTKLGEALPKGAIVVGVGGEDCIRQDYVDPRIPCLRGDIFLGSQERKTGVGVCLTP